MEGAIGGTRHQERADEAPMPLTVMPPSESAGRQVDLRAAFGVGWKGEWFVNARLGAAIFDCMK